MAPGQEADSDKLVTYLILMSTTIYNFMIK